MTSLVTQAGTTNAFTLKVADNGIAQFECDAKFHGDGESAGATWPVFHRLEQRPDWIPSQR